MGEGQRLQGVRCWQGRSQRPQNQGLHAGRFGPRSITLWAKGPGWPAARGKRLVLRRKSHENRILCGIACMSKPAQGPGPATHSGNEPLRFGEDGACSRFSVSRSFCSPAMPAGLDQRRW